MSCNFAISTVRKWIDFVPYPMHVWTDRTSFFKWNVFFRKLQLKILKSSKTDSAIQSNNAMDTNYINARSLYHSFDDCWIVVYIVCGNIDHFSGKIVRSVVSDKLVIGFERTCLVHYACISAANFVQILINEIEIGNRQYDTSLSLSLSLQHFFLFYKINSKHTETRRQIYTCCSFCPLIIYNLYKRKQLV